MPRFARFSPAHPDAHALRNAYLEGWEADYDSPLARGIVFIALPCGAGSRAFDLHQGVQHSHVRQGPHGATLGAAGQRYIPELDEGEFTLFARLLTTKTGNWSGFNTILSYSYFASGTDNWNASVQCVSGAATLQVLRNNNNSNTSNIGSFTRNQGESWGIRHINNTTAFYRNGGVVSAAAAHTHRADDRKRLSFGVGAENYAAAVGYAWNRALSDEEIQFLEQEPFTLIRPVRRRVFSFRRVVVPPHLFIGGAA